MVSSLVTGAEALTFARRNPSSSSKPYRFSGLGAHETLSARISVAFCGLNLCLRTVKVAPRFEGLSCDRPDSEPWLFQVSRYLEDERSVMLSTGVDGRYVPTGRQNFKVQQEDGPSILNLSKECSVKKGAPFLWMSVVPCGVISWLTSEQEACATETLGSNMVYEIGAFFELGIQLSYLLILLGLLGAGTFFVIRQVLVRRELDLSAKELQEQVRSGDASATEYFELGAVMLRRKFYPAAKKYLQQAIEKWDPNDQDLAQVYNALGVCYVRDEKLDKAITQFEKAVKLQPGYVTAWNNLGDAYERKKEFDAALKAFEEVLLFDPNNQIARPRRDALKDRANMFKGVSIKSKDK